MCILCRRLPSGLPWSLGTGHSTAGENLHVANEEVESLSEVHVLESESDKRL